MNAYIALMPAQEVLQNIASRVGTLPVIELEQANVYLGQKRYKEALSIYERILPEWNPPSEKIGHRASRRVSSSRYFVPHSWRIGPKRRPFLKMEQNELKGLGNLKNTSACMQMRDLHSLRRAICGRA